MRCVEAYVGPFELRLVQVNRDEVAPDTSQISIQSVPAVRPPKRILDGGRNAFLPEEFLLEHGMFPR